MKTPLVMLALCATVAFVGAQAQNPDPQNQKPAPDVSVTGCLLQGSAPSVFLLDNARRDPTDRNEKAVKYMVVVGAQDVTLRTHLNHEVQLTGQPEVKPAPEPGQKVEEKDLAKFTAKTITMVSDTCSTSR